MLQVKIPRLNGETVVTALDPEVRRQALRALAKLSVLQVPGVGALSLTGKPIRRL
jgi:hypothetical protein